MRIISGDLKGKKLLTPLDKSTRPLKDIVRESIFNILEHSNKVSKKITNSNVLDLFDFEYLGEYLNFLFLGLLKIFIKLTYFFK